MSDFWLQACVTFLIVLSIEAVEAMAGRLLEAWSGWLRWLGTLAIVGCFVAVVVWPLRIGDMDIHAEAIVLGGVLAGITTSALPCVWKRWR